MPASQSDLSRVLRDHPLYRPNPSFANPRWEEASQRVLILRLSRFDDVQRSSPHLFLAHELRAADARAYVDMAFLPGREDARVLQEMGLPAILGTQSGRGLREFGLVLVSNSYILELVNLPWLLARSGVPFWAGERDNRWPPIILGGSNASACHAIVREDGDCMADAIFFGEGEGAVGAIVRGLRERAHMARKARVAEMAAEVPGLWPAGSASATRRAAATVTDRGTGAWRAPVLPGKEAGTARISITRGCPCFCSFCFEGHDRRPYREVPAAQLIAQARALKKATGAGTLEIESFTFNTHSALAELLPALHRLFHEVGLMSQRVDILARTPGLLDFEIAADKRSFTLGIEGVSSRMRKFLRKSLEESDIRAAVEALHSRRTRELKLFYLLTGREEESDFADLAAFMKWLKETRRRAEAPRIVFSFGLLVRMPFTPLRHAPLLLSERSWRPLIGRAKSICETNGFEFRLAQSWSAYAATQALALSGADTCRLLMAIAARGCISDESLPADAEQDVEEWIEAHKEKLLPEKPVEHEFAFPFLDTEASRAALHAQYRQSLEGRDAAYGWDRFGPGAGGISAASTRELAALTGRKHRLKPVFLRARLPRECAGLGREWAEAWLMRRIFEERPDLIDSVLSVRECMIEDSGILGPETGWFGWTVVALTAWDTQSLASLPGILPSVFQTAGSDVVAGTVTRLRALVDLPGSLFPDPVSRLAAFLGESHCPVTVTREGSGMALLPAGKSLKKKMLQKVRFDPTESGQR
ncbi:MAG TPA: radical SAM protein, partial [Spirochaetia bacterium]|nr:radical SAM protein [Spirochaetia bacterium]